MEVELQREYEGKASYPNYVMSGVIDGFPEMEQKMGLKDVVAKPQLRGLWTWTRGGGWWGPYIHGNEHGSICMRACWRGGGHRSRPRSVNRRRAARASRRRKRLVRFALACCRAAAQPTVS